MERERKHLQTHLAGIKTCLACPIFCSLSIRTRNPSRSGSSPSRHSGSGVVDTNCDPITSIPVIELTLSARHSPVHRISDAVVEAAVPEQDLLPKRFVTDESRWKTIREYTQYLDPVRRAAHVRRHLPMRLPSMSLPRKTRPRLSLRNSPA